MEAGRAFDEYAHMLDAGRPDADKQRVLQEAGLDERLTLDEFRMLVDLAYPFPGA